MALDGPLTALESFLYLKMLSVEKLVKIMVLKNLALIKKFLHFLFVSLIKLKKIIKCTLIR
jgi:hypothetical protein